MSESEADDRCIAKTKSGSRCKNMVQSGSLYCYVHRSAAMKGDVETDVEEQTLEGKEHYGDSPLDEDLQEQAAESDGISNEELWKQLIQELNELVARVRSLDPTYVPASIAQNGPLISGGSADEEQTYGSSSGFLSRLFGKLNRDLLDPEMWQGLWYMANYTVEYQADIAKRRLRGDYETDEWGLDWEFLEAIRPFLDFMYNLYWRVEATGIENIPDYDRAVLVSNQSGQIPWDGLMIMTAVLSEHPAQRLVRNLYAEWFPSVPFLSSALVKIGQTLASEENGVRLLEQDELLCVYPEGYKGFSKSYKDRYKLKRFEWSEFVVMALKTQSPIIPISVVGAEESYIRLANIPGTRKAAAKPFFPITVRFPWMGMLGTVPLPTKWYIDVGKVIDTTGYGPSDAADLVLVSKLADQTRDTVQEMVSARLAQRHSAFH